MGAPRHPAGAKLSRAGPPRSPPGAALRSHPPRQGGGRGARRSPPQLGAPSGGGAEGPDRDVAKRREPSPLLRSPGSEALSARARAAPRIHRGAAPSLRHLGQRLPDPLPRGGGPRSGRAGGRAAAAGQSPAGQAAELSTVLQRGRPGAIEPRPSGGILRAPGWRAHGEQPDGDGDGVGRNYSLLLTGDLFPPPCGWPFPGPMARRGRRGTGIPWNAGAGGRFPARLCQSRPRALRAGKSSGLFGGAQGTPGKARHYRPLLLAGAGRGLRLSSLLPLGEAGGRAGGALALPRCPSRPQVDLQERFANMPEGRGQVRSSDGGRTEAINQNRSRGGGGGCLVSPSPSVCKREC